jgi:hypothetical protein
VGIGGEGNEGKSGFGSRIVQKRYMGTSQVIQKSIRK